MEKYQWKKGTPVTCELLAGILHSPVLGLSISKDEIALETEAPIPESDLRKLDSLFIEYARAASPLPHEKAKYIDAQTGQAINAQIHPFSPIEEQVGILRAQVVRILNTLGIDATPEFAALNDLTIKEIEAGRAKKEAL